MSEKSIRIESAVCAEKWLLGSKGKPNSSLVIFLRHLDYSALLKIFDAWHQVNYRIIIFEHPAILPFFLILNKWYENCAWGNLSLINKVKWVKLSKMGEKGFEINET